MCKGLASLPTTCLRGAREIKHRIGFLLQKPDPVEERAAGDHKKDQTRTKQSVEEAEVKKWGESLDALLSHSVGFMAFRGFLKTEFSQENIEFWEACEDYKRTPQKLLSAKAEEILDTYIEANSPKEVNLDSPTREETRMKAQLEDQGCFDGAQRKIFLLMEGDSYRRFLKSRPFLELLQQASRRKSRPALGMRLSGLAYIGPRG